MGLNKKMRLVASFLACTAIEILALISSVPASVN